MDRVGLPQCPQRKQAGAVMNQQALFDAGVPVFAAFVGRPIELSTAGDKSRAAQLALLTVLLKSRSGRASTDDIVRDASKPYTDGGKWLGPAIRELVEAGLIRQCGANRSKRESRNGGLLNVWELTDVAAAKQKVKRLRAALSFTEKADPVAATTEPAESLKTTSKGETNNGQAI
ncbi:hypothetical protein [Rhodopirellula sallentina]